MAKASGIRSRPTRSTRSPLVSVADVTTALELPMLFAIGTVLPRSSWPSLASAYVAARSRMGSRRHARLVETLERTLPGAYGTAPDVARELEVHRYLHYLDVARVYGRPDGSPPIDLLGLEHLEAALARGRGAILLVGHFVHNGLAPKVGLAQAGYPVTHLSRPEHGFSKTRVGMRMLNPVRRRAEDRYLSHRALVSSTSPASALRRLIAELDVNGVISITAGAWEGTRIVDTELLGRSYPIASGAFSLARRSGAAILPVVALRDDDTSVLTVTIERPVSEPLGLDKTEAMLQMGADVAAAFAPHVEHTPGQFRGWSYLEPRN